MATFNSSVKEVKHQVFNSDSEMKSKFHQDLTKKKSEPHIHFYFLHTRCNQHFLQLKLCWIWCVWVCLETKKSENHSCSVSMYVCLSWHLFTVATADFFPQNASPGTITHTYINTHLHSHSKRKEVWIMLAISDGQENQTHLETIGHRAQAEWKVAPRGEELLPLG